MSRRAPHPFPISLPRRVRPEVAAIAVTAAALAVLAAFGMGSDRRPASGPQAISSSSAPPLRLLEVRAGGVRRTVIGVRDYTTRGRLDAARLARRLRSLLPPTQTATRRRASTVYRMNFAATARRAVALGTAGGEVEVVRQPISAVVKTPIVRQRLRNNCESAALSILLASLGRPTDQLRIQRTLPTSGPLDPRGSGAGRVWGDPDIGYVGRADGGGVAGGFGVYPGPAAAAGSRFGLSLRVGRFSSVEALRQSLLAGRPAMLWIGLSDGPYGAWSSPSGRRIRVNFGEHTVVAYGVRRDGSFLISNPLEGTREAWSSTQLATLWERLGRRSVTGS